MKKKPKVAVLIDAWFPFYGGGQVHVKEIISRLDKDFNLIVFHATSTSLLSRLFWAFTVIPQVIIDHRKNRFDLIHAHAYVAGLPGKILAKILKIPVIFTVHGCNTLDLYKLTKNQSTKLPLPNWKYYLEKWLLTGIDYDYQISVTNHFLRYNNINKKITVIPNGVDTKEFDTIKQKKNKQFTILFIGRDDPVKGIRYLDRAIKGVKKKHPQIKYVKKTGGISKRADLIKLYKSSHLFVLPSLSEGHPLTLLEAWAAKLPVITTDVGDNSRMVKNGKNGYLVALADEKALASTISKAYKNSNLEELGKSGYNLVNKHYTWRKVAKATEKIYKEVLNGTR